MVAVTATFRVAQWLLSASARKIRPTKTRKCVIRNSTSVEEKMPDFSKIGKILHICGVNNKRAVAVQ